MKRIAIIGGGISGLSAAVALERARSGGAEVEYRIFESAGRLGGVLVTERVAGCLVEAGPDSFLTEKSWGLDFCRSLGLGDQLIPSNDADRKTYIVVRGRLQPIPDGLQFMVPTRVLPILTTGLFSLGSKLRMALEVFEKPAANSAGRDETVAEMVERHFGREMVERLADPLLAGVYGGSATELSAAAVLPRFVEMEKRYGSLSRAMLAARKQRAQAERADGRKLAPPPRPLFTSLKEGMQQLAETAISCLAPGAALLSNPVRALQRESEGWRVVARDCATEIFNAVIVATPAPAAGALLGDVHAALADELKAIPYSSSMTVTLGYDKTGLAGLPPGFGFLVPRREGRRMLACTFVHVKFPHRAPADRGIIRAFLGGSRDEAALELNDEEVLATVRRELQEILDLKAEPLFSRVHRWKGAMAQYTRGHLARVERIGQFRQELPGLELAGNAYRGIGVPDCIASGLAAAESVLE
jgi:oxygen-dependent protoporphyrinogen oxidase